MTTTKTMRVIEMLMLVDEFSAMLEILDGCVCINYLCNKGVCIQNFSSRVGVNAILRNLPWAYNRVVLLQ